jgi:outer membrane protein assembly factor BamD
VRSPSWRGRNCRSGTRRLPRESFESFRELITRFPDSRYTPDAKARMTYIVNRWRSTKCTWRATTSPRRLCGGNQSGAGRTGDYRDVPALEEALFILVRSYDALGMTQLRDDARRVLEKNYRAATI